jgi:nitroreductase
MQVEVDLDSVDWVLRTTRSVRRRLDFDRPVEDSVLEQCIELAIQAPTGINSENWRFLIITDPSKKAAIANIYRQALEVFANARGAPPKPTHNPLAERLHEIPALILVCGFGEPPAQSLPLQVGFYGSILPAAWSLMLALRARGLGSTWTSLHLLYSLTFGVEVNAASKVSNPCARPKRSDAVNALTKALVR